MKTFLKYYPDAFRKSSVPRHSRVRNNQSNDMLSLQPATFLFRRGLRSKPARHNGSLLALRTPWADDRCGPRCENSWRNRGRSNDAAGTTRPSRRSSSVKSNGQIAWSSGMIRWREHDKSRWFQERRSALSSNRTRARSAALNPPSIPETRDARDQNSGCSGVKRTPNRAAARPTFSK